MDEAAERRIERRLTAFFGDGAPASAYGAQGLQTWGTFFRDGAAVDERPERPPSPYTSLFLTDQSSTANGKVPLPAATEDEVVGKERIEEVGEEEEEEEGGEVLKKRQREETEGGGNAVEAVRKRPRAEAGSPEAVKVVRTDGAGVAGGKEQDDERGSGRESGEESEEDDESSDEEEDGEEEEGSSSSASGAEDGLARTASFRDQVADNERYRRRIRDAQGRAPHG